VRIGRGYFRRSGTLPLRVNNQGTRHRGMVRRNSGHCYWNPGHLHPAPGRSNLRRTLAAPLPDGALTIDYIVDGQNRRVGRLVNGTLVSGWLYQDQLRPVAQLDGTNSVIARFVYGSKANVPDYMVTSGGTYRILSDHLGSPRAVVDVSSGTLIETIIFDEFGNETDTLAGTLPTGYVRIPFGFAGGLYDPDTGLVRFGARDYDASVGRWTAKDPTGFEGESWNLYEYAGSDPVNHIDFSGDDWKTWTFGCSGLLKYIFPWCKYTQPDPCPGLRRAEVDKADKCSAIPKTCPLPGGVMKPGTMENDPDNAGPASQACIEAGKKVAEEQEKCVFSKLGGR